MKRKRCKKPNKSVAIKCAVQGIYRDKGEKRKRTQAEINKAIDRILKDIGELRV